MRKLCLLLVLMTGLAGCSHHGALAPSPAVQDDEAAELVVFRVNAMRAVGASFIIAVDGVDVYSMPNKSHKIFRLKAGEHVVSSKMHGYGIIKDESVIRISLPAGTRRYLALSPGGIPPYYVSIKEMTPQDGERQILKYR